MPRPRSLAPTGALLLVIIQAAAARTDEAAAIKAVEKWGGHVRVDDEQPGHPVVDVDLYKAKRADELLQELRSFKRLRGINLCGAELTDAGLRQLKEVKTLQGMNLSDTE